MKCIICKLGETQLGTTTVTLKRDNVTLVVKNVLAEVCEDCGEYYLSDEVSKKVMSMAEQTLNFTKASMP